MSKLCVGCGLEKEESEFSKTKYTTSGLRARCKMCSNQRTKEYRLKNIDRELDRARQYKKAHPEHVLRNKLKLYSLTQRDYDALQESQNNQCAICGKSSLKTLAIDHNHLTGKVRGLLCFSCNVLLGHAKDNIELLTNVISYLKKNGE